VMLFIVLNTIKMIEIMQLIILPYETSKNNNSSYFNTVTF